MDNISSLFLCIFFGEFGLLTLAPRYLFLVLFPILLLLEIAGRLLPLIPFLKENDPLVNQFLYSLIGLGCTTAAIASLDSLHSASMRARMLWILILLVPCSSQLALIAAFASMVTVRVFLLFFLLFACFTAVLYFSVTRLCPLNPGMCRRAQAKEQLHLLTAVKNAFFSVLETAPAFCAGSAVISVAMYSGLLDALCRICAPLMDTFLYLPPEAFGLLLLNVLKRDFGSASLLSFAGAFDGFQIITLLLMMIFSVPCFNSTILLFKQQGFSGAGFIWLGSLLLSLLIGRICSSLFLLLG